MTIELKLNGTICNFNCRYCYESETRSIEKRVDPDISAMLATARKLGDKFSLFGGEPLILPLATLERLFAEGVTGIQTNGALITNQHIKLFNRYRVSVGVSIDGPDELNSLRTSPEITSQIMHSIEQMRAYDISVSVISVIHKRNALPDRLTRFKEFGMWLDDMGIVNVNCHFMQRTPECVDESLTEEEETNAFLDLACWLRDRVSLRWQPFTDVVNLLMGSSNNVLCVWRGCDPYTTSAVQNVEADGSLRNCSRLVRKGPNWLKADKTGYQRQEVLAASDQETGGCKGCRFLPLCTGGCPGEAIDGDWRNRTEHCPTIKALMRFYEDILLNQGQIPTSVQKGRKWVEIDSIGHADHGDLDHGDIPHGDHTDYALNQKP